MLRVIAVSTIVTMLASGCATTGEPLTTDQKIASCVGMVLGGIVLARVLGKAGEKGAAVGLAVCGVWLAFNNEADRRRLRDAQSSAASSGKPQRQNWVDTQNNTPKTLSVQPGENRSVEVAGVATVCREVQTTVTANGQSSGAFSTEWCRSPDGSYKPRSELVAVQ